MSGPVSALAFAYVSSARNRLRAQLRRARSPRYLLAVVMGMFYLWWVLFRNSRFGGGPLSPVLRTELVQPIMAAFLLIASARWWIFGADRSTLAFSAAEVQFLFSAPVTRRFLVHSKLLRIQLAILFNTVIFSVLLRGGGGSAEGWRRGIALWIGFSVLALHRLGAALVRANALEHEHAGRRRSALPILIFGALLGAVAWGLLSQTAAIRASFVDGPRGVLRAVLDALHQPIPWTALWPVRTVLAPAFALDARAWWTAFPPAALILLAHYIWVIRLDGAFEEAAIEATLHRAERIQRFRTSQMAKTRSKRGKLVRVPRLSVRGMPAVAIAWKNMVAAMRGGAWRSQLVSFTVGLVVMAIVIRTASEDAADLFAGVTIGWGAMLVFLGPLWMRFDLRLDLPRLTILKTWPLPGRQIVAAEIAAVTLLHSITIWSLMTVPVVMLLMDPNLLTESIHRIPAILAVALAIPLLNALMFTVQNATALLFPAWVRLGTEARGFETMGQNMLTMGATSLVAAVALVFPVGLALLVVFFGRGLGSWSWPAATLVGGAVLIAELWPLIYWLGDLFEQLDVAETAAGAA